MKTVENPWVSTIAFTVPSLLAALGATRVARYDKGAPEARWGAAS